MALQNVSETDAFLWLLICFNLVCFLFVAVVISVMILWKKYEASLVVQLEHELNHFTEHLWTISDAGMEECLCESIREEEYAQVIEDVDNTQESDQSIEEVESELVEEGNVEETEELEEEKEEEVISLLPRTRIRSFESFLDYHYAKGIQEQWDEECMVERPPIQEEAARIEAEEKPIKASCFRNVLKAIFRRKGKRNRNSYVIEY